jgi:putative colanic acid biosynthesis UDP-glucose lipid carrier transferase
MPNIVADDTALSINPISSESHLRPVIQREAADTRTKRVLMIGYGKTAQKLHQRVQQQRPSAYRIVAIHAITRLAISEIWIALPFSELSRWHQLQPLLCQCFVDLRWVPDTDTMTILSHRYRDFLGIPMVDLNHPASTGLRGLGKALFDRGFALCVLILLLPLFAVHPVRSFSSSLDLG